MIIREFLELLDQIGEFETDKLKFCFTESYSLEVPLFFTSDSRKIKKNSVFIPIKGEKVDGHDYINQGFKNGAILSFIEKPGDYEGLCLKVDNVIHFINKMASFLFSKYSGYTIAITGSNGKTTTKEWIKNLLSVFLNKNDIFANTGNMNTEIGLPLCILNNLTTPKKVSVIEMGMSKKGDIQYLVDTYKPDFPVVLNIGTAHIGNTGSLKNTFLEKIKLFKYHEEGEPFGINCSDRLLRKYLENNLIQKPILFGEIKDQKKSLSGVYLDQYQYTIQNKSFLTEIKLVKFNGKKEIKIHRKLQGIFHKGQLIDLCASMAAVSSLGYDVELIPDLSELIRVVKDRFEAVFVGDHLFIKDCYNSSLESLAHALEILKNLKDKKHLRNAYCVLGSIAETGSFESDIHEKVGTMLNENQIDTVFLYTKDKRIEQIQKTYTGQVLTFEKSVTLSHEIKKLLKKRQKSVFLFKASRSIQLEEVFDHVMDVID